MYPMERRLLRRNNVRYGTTSALIWEMIACPSERVERERQSSFAGMDMLSFPKKRQTYEFQSGNYEFQRGNYEFQRGTSAVIWEMIACPSERVERERHSSFSGMDMLSFPKKTSAGP